MAPGRRTWRGGPPQATCRRPRVPTRPPYGGGGGDAFVAEFNASGSALIYSTYIGGSGYDVASSIALDATGNAYVAGYNYAAGFPTTQGAYQTATRGLYDGFITKLNASGSALVYSTYLGGTGMTMSWVSVSISGQCLCNWPHDLERLPDAECATADIWRVL